MVRVLKVVRTSAKPMVEANVAHGDPVVRNLPVARAACVPHMEPWWPGSKNMEW